MSSNSQYRRIIAEDQPLIVSLMEIPFRKIGEAINMLEVNRTNILGQTVTKEKDIKKVAQNRKNRIITHSRLAGKAICDMFVYLLVASFSMAALGHITQLVCEVIIPSVRVFFSAPYISTPLSKEYEKEIAVFARAILIAACAFFNLYIMSASAISVLAKMKSITGFVTGIMVSVFARLISRSMYFWFTAQFILANYQSSTTRAVMFLFFGGVPLMILLFSMVEMYRMARSKKSVTEKRTNLLLVCCKYAYMGILLSVSAGISLSGILFAFYSVKLGFYPVLNDITRMIIQFTQENISNEILRSLSEKIRLLYF